MLVILLDLLWLSPVPFPFPETKIQTPGVYEKILADPGKGGVLELPVWVGDTSMMPRARFTHQVFHGRPIADNISGHVAPYLLENNLTLQLLKLGSPFRYSSFPDTNLESAAQGLDRLRADGFDFILLKKDQYPPQYLANTLKLLNSLLPEPEVEKEGYLLYRLRNAPKISPAIKPAIKQVVESEPGK